ncbi:MAG: fasciclin domain-containing protein [Cyanobacteria bacterium P01_H01_bin.58]
MKNATLLASVLTVASVLLASPAQALETKDDHAASSNTIAAIASSSGSFDVLTALLKRAELVGVLNGDTEFTVFAPTDDAFGRLPKGTIESLFQEENKELLATILTYHVVPGTVRSTDLASGNVDSVAGIPLEIALGSGVSVNNASVVQADIDADNGVIHIIDTVLLPPQ